ncbi:unnamed protein product [Didymodactylos carnosus]|uniref:Uncharacterized protein n=1 Tax=Didymodactylos carnosus TaxID=1234261 RepID=A0A8S2HA79_9BILA|nr:unnamed protein product [Didymodactylos carnosus]CAF3619786.1 unnamed protein product [Didymodactylos carnosus]
MGRPSDASLTQQYQRGLWRCPVCMDLFKLFKDEQARQQLANLLCLPLMPPELTDYVLRNYIDCPIYPIEKWNHFSLIQERPRLNMCFPLIGIFYTRGQGIVQNEYYQIGVTRKIPIYISEIIHGVTAVGWLFVTAYFNLQYGIVLIKNHTLLFGYIYFGLSAFLILMDVGFILMQIIITINSSDHNQVDQFYCPDCTEVNIFQLNKPFFVLNEQTAQVLSKDACRRCLRPSPTESGILSDIGNQLQVPIKLQPVSVSSTDLMVAKMRDNSWFGQYIKPSTYVTCHGISFVVESIAFFGTAIMAIAGALMRKYAHCFM